MLPHQSKYEAYDLDRDIPIEREKQSVHMFVYCECLIPDCLVLKPSFAERHQ